VGYRKKNDVLRNSRICQSIPSEGNFV